MGLGPLRDELARFLSRPSVRFVVYGAGAVGGVIGARLFQHGHEVALIARGPHREAIARAWPAHQSPVEDVTLPIPVRRFRPRSTSAPTTSCCSA